MTLALALLATLIVPSQGTPTGTAPTSRPVETGVARAAATDGEPRALEVELEGSGGLGLFGTLVLPANAPAGGAPALVLLPGSSPTDRDGNQKPYITTDLLKSIAEALAAEGIASLRFDKRAAARYQLRLMELTVAEQDAFLAWDRFVEDAQRAFGFLRGRDEIDAARCGLLGHSEGGLIALEVARRTASVNPPAVLVLASTAGTTMTELLRYQIGKIIAPYPEPVRDQLMAEFERVAAHVVESGAVPADVPPGLQAWFPNNAANLLAVELALDPAALAPKVRGPVLILHGEHDVQVPPETHVERLASGFRGRTDASDTLEVVLVPGASHNLKPVASPDEPGFEGTVVPEALSRLCAWLAAHLAR